MKQLNRMVELVSLNDYTVTVRVDGEREYTLFNRGDQSLVLDYDVIDDYEDVAWIYDALADADFITGLSSSYFFEGDEIPECWRGGIE